MKMKRRGCRFDALGVFGIEKATPKNGRPFFIDRVGNKVNP